LATRETTSLPPESRPRRLGDSEFDYSLSWNLDLLLGLGIEADASLPLLLYELAKSGQDEFSILFDRLVGEVAEVPAKRNAFCVLLHCHCWCSLVSLM
jgi:hypothetical protein